MDIAAENNSKTIVYYPSEMRKYLLTECLQNDKMKSLPRFKT